MVKRMVKSPWRKSKVCILIRILCTLTNRRLLDSNLSGQFSPNRQSWRLFKDQFFHLSVTLILVTLFVISLALWQNHNVSHQGKVWFNTLLTILNLALALNFLEAFKDMAKIGRWRILSSRPYTPREVDLILGGESLMKLTSLLFECLRPLKLTIVLACASWIFLNFLAQATIAMLSLNYSMDQGIDSIGTYTQSGTVQAPNLSCFFLGKGCPVQPGASMVIAHNYGEFVSSQNVCLYHNDSEILSGDQSCDVFKKVGAGEHAYRFSDYNPDDTNRAYPYLSNRTIKVSVEQCYQYDIDFNNSPTVSSLDGTNDVQVLAFTNQTYTGHIPIPRADGAFNATTYIYNGTDMPMSTTQVSCGPRCLRMYVYRLGDANYPAAASDTHIFSCQISVSEVFNATRPWHELSDANARLAIASIALTGRFTGDESHADWRQYRYYTWGSYFEVYGLNAAEVGGFMASFTIGSLANMAIRNPLQLRPGIVPILGYHLDNNWTYILVLLICIAVAHCFLVAAILWISRPVVVLEDSDLSTARLLHGLVGKVDGQGSLISPKALATELRKRLMTTKGSSQFPDEQHHASSETGKVIYGISRRDDLGGLQTLDLGEDVMVRRRFDGSKFPKGLYA